MGDPRIWHPFTPLAASPEPLKVRRGSGAWLELDDGRRLFDGISSWWVNLHGHGHPHIAQAIGDQARQLEQVIFAGFTHDPAERLVQRLSAHLPAGLDRFFFSDNGSTAVEVALKIAWQYWRNRNANGRMRILAFERAYHGDTFGAMAAGARSEFSAAFEPLLFAVDRVPFPATWLGDSSVEEREAAVLDQLQRQFEQAPDAHAAMIIEPLVQGAGGMQMCRPEFLRAVIDLVRRHGVLVILDEVMTGFGRTGALFACRRAGVVPDLICLSKGLTGGFLPMALTVATAGVQDAFRSADPRHTFWHGHSYTASPLGCAAALASLDLLEACQERIAGWEARHGELLAIHRPPADRHRVCGTIMALDVRSPQRSGYFDPVGSTLREAFLEDGILLRPLGNVLYLMPPYCTTDDELDWVYATITRRLSALPL